SSCRSNLCSNYSARVLRLGPAEGRVAAALWTVLGTAGGQPGRACGPCWGQPVGNPTAGPACRADLREATHTLWTEESSAVRPVGERGQQRRRLGRCVHGPPPVPAGHLQRLAAAEDRAEPLPAPEPPPHPPYSRCRHSKPSTIGAVCLTTTSPPAPSPPPRWRSARPGGPRRRTPAAPPPARRSAMPRG